MQRLKCQIGKPNSSVKIIDDGKENRLIRLIQQQDGKVSWLLESARKGLNTTSGAQFAALPLVKPMVKPVF